MEHQKLNNSAMMNIRNHPIISFLVAINIFNFGCQGAKDLKPQMKMYKDYSFRTKSGINELSEREFEVRNEKGLPSVQVLYKDNSVDSIKIINLSKGDSTTEIRAYLNDSMAVYEIKMKDPLYGFRKFYLVYNSKFALDYDFLSPVVYVDSSIDCQITYFSIDSTKTEVCRIKQIDTTGFINRLLSNKAITKIVDKTRPSTIKFGPDFSLLTYFGR
jgi:hypothetical protein